MKKRSRKKKLELEIEIDCFSKEQASSIVSLSFDSKRTTTVNTRKSVERRWSGGKRGKSVPLRGKWP